MTVPENPIGFVIAYTLALAITGGIMTLIGAIYGLFRAAEYTAEKVVAVRKFYRRTRWH